MKRALKLILPVLLLLSSAQAQGVKVKGEFGLGLFKERGKVFKGKLTDGAVELEGSYRCFNFNAAVGSLLTPTLTSSEKEQLKGNFGLSTKDKFGFLWGSVNAQLSKSFSVEAGVLTTMVGQELPLTTQNLNTLFGLVWGSQPFIYKGVRSYYEKGDYTAYGEYDFGIGLNGKKGDRAFAFGLIKDKGKFQFGANYFDYRNYKNLIDLSAGKSFGSIFVSLNLDYQWLDSSAKKRGIGVALYLEPKLGKFTLPLRVERVKDFKDSGIYGFKKATYSITVSPTYRVNENLFLRAEVGEVKNSSLSRLTYAFQLGLSF
ncbi:outer membrane beta-barrel protein [Thermovibrio sp.]